MNMRKSSGPRTVPWGLGASLSDYTDRPPSRGFPGVGWGGGGCFSCYYLHFFVAFFHFFVFLYSEYSDLSVCSDFEQKKRLV